MLIRIANKLNVLLSFVVTNVLFSFLESLKWITFSDNVSKTLIIIFVSILAIDLKTDSQEQTKWEVEKKEPIWEIEESKKQKKAKK
jgi:hypothetical protein